MSNRKPETKKKARIAADSEADTTESITKKVCERMRHLRRKKGWTLEQLSSLCGVSRSMLSQIERGSASPTLGVAFRIAQAFGLSLGDLVDGLATPREIEVIRSDDPRYQFRSDKSVKIRTLSPLRHEKKIEFYALTIHPQGALRSDPHYEGTHEFLTVEKGRVRVVSDQSQEELASGDSARYAADVPHEIKNLGDEDALLYLVVIYAQD